jgi:hypothetical protein
VWPVPDLVIDVRDLLQGYYDREATPGTAFYHRAPEWEQDKVEAAKDPDTLWEYHGGPGTACHGAASAPQFIDCAGYRLAATLGRPYGGGLTLFDAGAGYYTNEATARIAGFYALYHAFVRDFDAPDPDPNYAPANARNARRYHERMLRAYEAHARDVIARMFRDTRSNAAFQFDLTRSAGLLAIGYVPVVQAMEERGLWATPSDRRNALALVNGLNQRIWWEWVWTQGDGPPTAGFVDVGSEGTYLAAVAAAPGLAGTHQFVYDGVPVPSLRPAAQDGGAWNGLWVDADYALPGEWWCYGRYTPGSSERTACLQWAKRQSRNTLEPGMTPFGQYYGPAGPAPCDDRAGAPTAYSCQVTNLGSIAEEWSWTFGGARLGMYLVRSLAAAGDADTPAGAVGPNGQYETVTDRLGYGVSGWHGGDPYHDDLEWLWNQNGGVQAIRTLSGGRHDFELQDGRYSRGEASTSPQSTARKGDTWPIDRGEHPGGMENHAPGPNELYGTSLFGYVLADKVADGLSGSLFDAPHRNHTDEFNSWIWLMQSSYFRCLNPAGDDPAGDGCFAFSTAHWPNPATISRVPLYNRPEDGTIHLHFRYLWRDAYAALSSAAIADRDTSCRGQPGVPWRHANDWSGNSNSGFLMDEGGYGAYNQLLQGLGGTMRLVAARYAVEPDAVQRDQVQAPWFDDAYDQVKAILALYSSPPPAGYGYVPDIENSTCAGFDPHYPGLPSRKHMLTWQVGTGDTVAATTARRAMWYSIASVWYAWYDSSWLEVDPSAW